MVPRSKYEKDPHHRNEPFMGATKPSFPEKRDDNGDDDDDGDDDNGDTSACHRNRTEASRHHKAVTPVRRGYSHGSLNSYHYDDGFSAMIPHLAAITFRVVLGITVALYVLNQSHLLPRPLSSVVSRALFWPTLPITASKRIGKWVTRIDDTVYMGGAPISSFLLKYPERLKQQYGIHGVINLCEEYKGPLRQYKQLGMEELYLPTTDHFEPSQEDIMSALSFIKRHEAQGKKVYVHCRAGHGRSGAVVFAWLLLKDPTVDPRQLNADFCKIRNVRGTLWKQPNVQAVHKRFLRTYYSDSNNKGSFEDAQDAFFFTDQGEARHPSSSSTGSDPAKDNAMDDDHVMGNDEKKDL
mmetsp:Transcript_29565/g.55427  ORF Transcript_29565/g.55427 Transcript_29565/m.55427 type:complete len:353 (+) Transcript_29565:228-1286(+)